MDLFTATASCQMCGISKTKSVLFYMLHLKKEADINDTTNINIVFVNNNLKEITQMVSRCEELEISTNTISSNETTEKNISSEKLKIKYYEAKNKNHIADTIICCNNPSQVKSIVEYINAVNNFKHPFVSNVSFNIFIDEIDNNLSMTNKLYKSIKDLTIVNSMTFISATIFQKTQKWYKEITEEELFAPRNLNNFLSEFYPKEFSKEQRTIDANNYIGIDKHTLIEVNDKDDDGLQLKELDYVIKCIKLHHYYFTNTLQEPRRVNVLAGYRIDSHNEIAKCFINIGYLVIVFNSDIKGGHIHIPNQEIISFDEFKQEHFGSNNVEMYVILAKLYDIYPQYSSAIVGNKITERGITFQSTGSPITTAIMCNRGSCEKKQQSIGRQCGDNKYVSHCDLFMPNDLYSYLLENQRIALKTYVDMPKEILPINCCDITQQLEEQRKLEKFTIPKELNLQKSYDYYVERNGNSQSFKNKDEICEMIKKQLIDYTDIDLQSVEDFNKKEMYISEPKLTKKDAPNSNRMFDNLENKNKHTFNKPEHMIKNKLIVFVICCRMRKKIIFNAYYGYKNEEQEPQ